MIKRYQTSGTEYMVFEHTEGEFVTYEDHAAIESALVEQAAEVDKANALIDELRKERDFLQRLAGERGNKLAELDKQEPAAFTSDYYWSELNRAGRVNCWLRNDRRDPGFQVELFTRPAPAVNLADLVPDEIPEREDEEGCDIDYLEPSEVYQIGKATGFNKCRATTLRNIEEAKK